MNPGACFLWVIFVGFAICLSFRLDAITEWDRRLSRAWRERWLGSKRDRTGNKSRPLDPIVETAREWSGIVYPDSLWYYRVKYILVALTVLVAAVVATIL